MCTLFLSVENQPDFPVILIENRDEFYARKSEKPFWWDSHDLYAGKDHEKGGTWLGYSSKGNWGVITNYRDLTQNFGGDRSRGDLIPEIVGKNMGITQAESFLLKTSDEFGPYNLMFSLDKKVYYFSSIKKELIELRKGVYGLSNAFLDTPWFKVKKGKKKFQKVIRDLTLRKSALFNMMLSEEKAKETELPQTGLPIDIEKLVSSLFIKSETYGTHCTTFLAKGLNGKILFEERRYIKQPLN